MFSHLNIYSLLQTKHSGLYFSSYFCVTPWRNVQRETAGVRERARDAGHVQACPPTNVSTLAIF